ncbi:hypothetical protein G7Y89_g4482 [Cudoniella acicularis]|uniref:Uncharacterized protein n=1 Tax=Cudoniella acicularis TaxID=354080 RepID=A0A8H4RSD7_9HELO|nr:hypothetical protein G7Y89_g4482 [Cudoniella acicularis]
MVLIPEEDVPVASVIVASDGSGTNSGNAYVWHLLQRREKTTLIPITHFSAHKNYITRLLSPDVKQIAICSADHTAKIWEVKDLESMIPIPG